MSQMRFIKLIPLLLFVFILSGSLSGRTSAQEESSLEISPAILDINGVQGNKVRAQLTLSNLSDEAKAISANVRALSPEDKEIDENVSERYNATGWISFPVKDFLIPPQKSVIINIDVEIPDNAVPGGHYALATFRVINDLEPDGSGVKVSTEGGAVMLISVPGEISEEALLETVRNNHVSIGGNVVVEQEILNTGNTHIVPIIESSIINSKGDVVDTIKHPLQILLPNTKRKITTQSKIADKIGLYTVKTTISYGTPSRRLESATKTFVTPSLIEITIWIASIYLIVKYSHRFLYSGNGKYKKYYDVVIIRRTKIRQSIRLRLSNMSIISNRGSKSKTTSLKTNPKKVKSRQSSKKSNSKKQNKTKSISNSRKNEKRAEQTKQAKRIAK